jgi:hypothetical protein
MKMNGPYDWVPPNYWYDKRSIGGGAAGFASEVSAGSDVPTMDTLRRMMTTSELNTLWQNFNATQYHRSQSSTFNTLRIFDNALAGRYGGMASLDDYVRKAQLAQYENVRAQFESFGRNFSDSSNPANGVIYWMLNSGWTSLHWQLFDAYLDQNGAYYGAKKASEPLHVQYSYDNRNVVVVNSRHGNASGLTVKVDLFNMDGTNKVQPDGHRSDRTGRWRAGDRADRPGVGERPVHHLPGSAAAHRLVRHRGEPQRVLALHQGGRDRLGEQRLVLRADVGLRRPQGAGDHATRDDRRHRDDQFQR